MPEAPYVPGNCGVSHSGLCKKGWWGGTSFSHSNTPVQFSSKFIRHLVDFGAIRSKVKVIVINLNSSSEDRKLLRHLNI